MGKAPALPSSPNDKRTFYLPDTLYAAMRDYVGRHRNAPESLSINEFVRVALETHLSKELKKEGRA